MVIKRELTDDEKEICLIAYKECPYGRDRLHHYIKNVMKDKGYATENITQRGVANWLLEQEFHQMNVKPNRAATNIKSVSLTATKSGTISLDLFQLPLLPNGKKDRGFAYVLVCVDVWTKYLWAKPIKDKSGITTQTAMYKLMQNDRLLNNATVFLFDNGAEFFQLKEQLESEGKKVINTLPHIPQSNIVERYNSTLKSGLNRLAALSGKPSWIAHLDTVVAGLNASRSVVNGRTADSLPKDKDPIILAKLDKLHKKNFGNSQTLAYKVGDKVRLRLLQLGLKPKAPFWSKEIYTISSILKHKKQPFLKDSYRIRKSNSDRDEKGYWEAGDLQLTKA